MKTKLSILKEIELEVKIGVVIIDILMTLYVLWLIATNTSTWLVGVLFGFTPYGAVVLLRAGSLFHLCTIHRLMIIHTMMVYACCVYQAEFGFQEYLSLFRYAMFIAGLMLFIIITIKLIRNECITEQDDSEDIL